MVINPMWNNFYKYKIYYVHSFVLHKLHASKIASIMYVSHVWSDFVPKDILPK